MDVVLSARGRARRAPLGPLGGIVVALGVVALGFVGSPACGSPCQGNDQFFCTPGGAQCVCAAPCSTYLGCATADPSTVRYCYLDIGGDPTAGVCLPALFFTGMCSDGNLCTGGQCDQANGCDLLCVHSSECVSGCCSLGPAAAANANPTCGNAGSVCLP
jgi:hypothetical protein